MKNLSLLLAFLFFVTSYSTQAAIGVSALVVNAPTKTSQKKFKKADLENQLGRKIKLREWLAFKIIGKKAVSQENSYDNDGTGLGIAGFILGLLGLISFNFLFALLGVIFTGVALKRMRQTGNPERGLAKAGLVCGIIGVVLGLAAVAFVFTYGGLFIF